MRNPVWMLVLLLLVLPGLLAGGEKKLMHCFMFTPVEAATDADWQAFFKATDALPGTIPGLSRVWYGKLRAPFAVVNTDGATRKKLAAGEKDVTGPVSRLARVWGVCMEMADEAALKTYAAHPAHKAWEEVYGKVRQPGTTTFDLLGQ